MTGAIVQTTNQLNVDSDREEGEIVDGDDYEFISSDELNEYNVRLRIKELEAKNEELEKIANISTSYSRKYNYLQRKYYELNTTAKSEYISYKNKSSRIHTDATSVSSVEFRPPKKRRNRGNTKYKNRYGTARRFVGNTFQSKKHNQVKRCMRRKRVSISFDEYNAPRNKISAFNRISLDSLPSSDIDDVYDSRDSRHVLIRDKLRFALARSPTESSLGCLRDRLQKEKDFLYEKQKNMSTFMENNIAKVSTVPDADPVVNIPSDNSMSLEEQELRLIALKSAVMKKHLARKKRNAEVAYSPTDFIVLGDSSSDDNIDFMNVDFYDYQNGMDISPSSSPVLAHIDLDTGKCKEIENIAYNKPIDMDIANSDSDVEHVASAAPSSAYLRSYTVGGQDQSHCTFHLATGKNFIDTDQAPPALPFHLHPSNQTNQLPAQENTHDMANEGEEEEEAALRALLLAKLPTTKAEGRSKSQKSALYNGPTESILKEAVRRLTIKTNCGNKDSVIEQVPQQHEPHDSECNGHPFNDEVMPKHIDNSAGNNLPFFPSMHISDTTEASLLQVELTNFDLKEQLEKDSTDSAKDITKIENILPQQPLKANTSLKVNDVANQTVIPSKEKTVQIFRPIQNQNANATPSPTTKPTIRTSISKNIENGKNKEPVATVVKDVPPGNEKKMVNVHHTSSVSTIKIVKPNKVINKVHQMKRKVVAIEPVCKKPKATEEPSSTDSRLLTSTSLPKIKVSKLVIALGQSDSDSDDEELSATNNADICHTIDSLYDNASPISLPMDTQCQVTPECSNSPIVEYDEDDHNPAAIVVNNDIFEQKLDNFLRNVRNKIDENSKQNNSDKNSSKGQSTYDAPMAVRHLPPASQMEYRKLIMRMHLLEKQKFTTNDKPKASNSKTGESTSIDSSMYPSSADQNPKSTVVGTPQCDSTSSSKLHILQAYEKSYFKTGTVIISNLDKSLSLVDEIKKAKISKLLQEERLKVLHAQIEEAQRKYLHDQQIIKKLSPNITGTNNVITTLKQRRSKFQKAAKELGKTLQGEKYRLNDSLNKEISQKLKKLASDIKNVNSINYSYVKNLKNDVSCVKNTPMPNYVAHDKEDKSTENVKIDSPKSVDETNTEANYTKLSPTNSNAAKLIICGTEQPATDQCQQKELLGDALKQKEDSTADSTTDATVLRNYVSPLVHLNCTQSQSINPNGVICPYELMGRCEDEECSFEHFSRKCEGS